MIKKLALAGSIAAVALLSGCVIPQSPMTGVFLTKSKSTTFLPGSNGSMDYTKKGSAKAVGFLGLAGIQEDDSSVLTAAKEGKISKVKFVEKDVLSYLMLYTEVTTTAYGD